LSDKRYSVASQGVYHDDCDGYENPIATQSVSCGHKKESSFVQKGRVPVDGLISALDSHHDAEVEFCRYNEVR